jgi:hypothetical protein
MKSDENVEFHFQNEPNQSKLCELKNLRMVVSILIKFDDPVDAIPEKYSD